ncbi:MAG TPA: M13-type metalloendopeptidase, partial [Burkholderiaceae bacterium]
ARKKWWTAEDSAGFAAAYAPLAAQFAAYDPLPGVAIDTARTRTENIADLAGLAAAFDAYRATLGKDANDPAKRKQLDRQFFIGYARSWRAAHQEPALRKLLASDNHAPERYRIATVRNLDAWYDAFDVRPGQQLYLAPEARVRVW